jgi:hypothetical protein
MFSHLISDYQRQLAIPFCLPFIFLSSIFLFMEESEHRAMFGARNRNRGGWLWPPRPARSRRREGESARTEFSKNEWPCQDAIRRNNPKIFHNIDYS